MATKQKHKPANLQDVLNIVWDALKKAHGLLEDSDPVMQLKAAHGVFQGAQAYSKLYETGELESRLAALENGHSTPARKDALNEQGFN